MIADADARAFLGVAVTLVPILLLAGFVQSRLPFFPSGIPLDEMEARVRSVEADLGEGHQDADWLAEVAALRKTVDHGLRLREQAERMEAAAVVCGTVLGGVGIALGLLGLLRPQAWLLVAVALVVFTLLAAVLFVAQQQALWRSRWRRSWVATYVAVIYAGCLVGAPTTVVFMWVRG